MIIIISTLCTYFRFSKDIDTADTTMRFNLRMVVQQLFRSIASITLITIQTPLFLVLVAHLSVIYYFVQVRIIIILLIITIIICREQLFHAYFSPFAEILYRNIASAETNWFDVKVSGVHSFLGNSDRLHFHSSLRSGEALHSNVQREDGHK